MKMTSRIIMICLLMISLGVNLGKHGQEKKEKYNFWESLIATIIEIAILYCGGFFGGE